MFGDGDLPAGSSVFGDVEDADLERASVFAAVDTEGLPTEAIESPSSSVFGDVAEDAGPVDKSPVVRDRFGSKKSEESSEESEESSETEQVALDLTDDAVSKPSDDASVEEDADELPVDDGTDDPIDLGGDPVTEIPEVTDEASASSTDFGNDITTGEAIALDVEPGDEDGLDAWSDLGTASDLTSNEPEEEDADSANHLDTEPAGNAQADEELGDPDATAAHDWTPAHAAQPADDDSDVVRIGTDSERFFEFDAEAPENAPIDIDNGGSAGSELQSRVLTGVALLAIAVIALSLGPIFALALIVIVVAISAGEFYNALRVAGYQPATLLGLTASIAMPIAVYVRGTQAVALVLALTVVFGLIWYIAGVANEMPVMNLGVTLLGVVYIGVLGSFGAALLETANRVPLEGVEADGTGLILAAVILTIGYDAGAFFAGRSMGRTPLTAISPNKTVEGLLGGFFMTIVVSVVFLSILKLIEPFSTLGSVTDALILGAAAAVMAPLGDLGESLIKRDLGIKDMGTILPGHGGFLDRFDALLFVLPTVYFLSLAFFFGA